MTANSSPDGAAQPQVFSGPVLDADAGDPGSRGGWAADGPPGAAGARGRQGLELIAGAVRGVAAALRVSAGAGLLAAVVIAGIWDAAFDMRLWKALVVLVVLALPALEVLLHRLVLVRTWGDAERLERRVRTVGARLTGGADDFTVRMTALRENRSRRARSGLGAARSALGLRDVVGAVPELAGLLLLPLRRGLLVFTAACAGICWVLLVVGVPAALLIGIGAAIVR